MHASAAGLIHRPVLRAVGATGCAAVLSLIGLQATAQATEPFHFDVTRTDTFVDPDVCAPYGFPVDTVAQISFSGIVKIDGNGNPYASINHVRTYVTLSANGKTVTDIDHLQAITEPDGTFREVGSPIHIMGPQGLLIRDSGQIIYNSDGTITIKGPHPMFEGTGTFCTALAP